MSSEIIHGPIAGASYYAEENRLRRQTQIAWLRQQNTAAAAIALQTVEAWDADKRARSQWETATRQLNAHLATY